MDDIENFSIINATIIYNNLTEKGIYWLSIFNHKIVLIYATESYDLLLKNIRMLNNTLSESN